MFKEDFFTRVALSYQQLISIYGEGVPSLRDHCHLHHAAYNDFIRWASTHEIAGGLLETDRGKRRMNKKIKVTAPTGKAAFRSSIKRDVFEEPLLYPLHIITDGGDNGDDTVIMPYDPPSGDQSHPPVLRGIRITFPNGIKICVREAESRGIYFLIHGKES